MTNIDLSGYVGESDTHNGFTIEIHHDDLMGAPWDEHDGHGIVSDWTRREKQPGERVLCDDHGFRRFYDVRASLAIAKRDGWDAEPYGTGTKGQRAARAVEADFQHLRGWCNDDWCWIGIVVTHDETGDTESLWGIESNSGEYLNEVARELIAEIQARIDEMSLYGGDGLAQLAALIAILSK